MAFSENALERLTRVAPELAKKVISFYDMTDEVPEGTGLSVGAFILKIGSTEVYIPVIANGGTVYPIDSIFVKGENRFIPITKGAIQKVLAAGQEQIGTPSKIPALVTKNPSIQEMVEPPRTGKYSYAGSMLPEAMTQLSPEGKTWFINKIAAESALMKNIHNLGVNVYEMQEALTKSAEMIPTRTGSRNFTNDHEALRTHAPVRVVTEPEEGLEDTVIQDILRHGYGIVGQPAYPRMVVEYSRSTEGFTKIPAACQGKAYEVVFKDGKNKIGIVPEMIRTQGLGILPNTPEPEKQHEDFIIFEDGSYSTSHDTVIRQVPRDSIMVIKNLIDAGAFTELSSVVPGHKIMVVTPKGFAGPMEVNNLVVSPSGTRISSYGSCGYFDRIDEVFISPNVDGQALLDGRSLYVTPGCKALILNCCASPDVETDLNRAITRYENSASNLVKEAHTLDFDGVEFHMDGSPVGTIDKIAKVLAVDCGLDAVTTKHFIKRAQENSRVILQMSKKAEINGVGPEDNSGHIFKDGYAPTEDCDIPEYGDKVNQEYGRADSGRVNRNTTLRKQASHFNVELIKEAAATKDPQVIEASIMSELLKDPAMGETISSYLPIIDEALDKLGRSILLLRVNNESMLDKVSPEEYSSLVAALRNTYKLLGENKITLEQLVTDGGEQ